MKNTSDSSSSYSTLRLIVDLWKILEGKRGKFIVATILLLLSHLVWLYPAYALSQLVDFLTTFHTGQSLQPIWIILFLWIIASCIHYVFEQIAFYIGFHIAEKCALDRQVQCLEHLLHLDLSWQEKENSGNKLKRIQRGGNGINGLIRMWFDPFLGAIVPFFGMIPILASFDIRIALIMLFFIVSFTALSYFITEKAGKAAHAVNTNEENIQGLLFETINNIRSVKVLGMHQGLLAIISLHIEGLILLITKRIQAFRQRETLLNLWAQIFRILLTFMVVFGVVNGQYTIGFLVLFYTYFNYIWESIGRLCGISLDFIIQKYGVSRMMEIFEEPLKIDENSGKVPFPAQWKKITIHNLCFSYGETEVLHSLCFDISKGERIGIVGISGAGKSTLFKLLLKEHENYSGTILIDGIDLRDINHTSFQEKTAVVLQETEVFHFSLQSNITLAHPRQELQKEFLDQAITVAHVQEFAEKLPQGMKTMIGEKGIKLSGGEKQRVGIARAIYKQPDILFLDEATSHLDSESELKIRDSLHHIFRNVTAIVIAHRLSTIQEMDRIIVLENGRIVESDTFDNLMKAKGRFRELWEKQNIPLY